MPGGKNASVPNAAPAEDARRILEQFTESVRALRRTYEEKIRGIIRRVEARRRREILAEVEHPLDGPSLMHPSL